MVEHIWPRANDGFKSLPVSAKIRDQHLNFTTWNARTNFGNGARKNTRAAIGLIVAIDGRHHRVAQTHELRRFGHALRLLLVRRRSGLARRYGAKSARSRANVAENHERRRAMFPTFTHVRAARTLAHRIKAQRAHDALQILIIRPIEKFDAQPVRARMSRRIDRNPG